MAQLLLLVAEGRVEEGMALGRQHAQGIARGELRVGLRRLPRGHVVGQRIEGLAGLAAHVALPEQREHHVAARRHRRLELALAGGRREVALPVRDEIVGRAEVEAGVTLGAQSCEVDAFER